MPASFKKSLDDRRGEAILFRVDSNPQVGWGHFSRCLAVAQAWQRRGNTANFAMRNADPVVRKRLGQEGFEVLELQSDDLQQQVSELLQMLTPRPSDQDSPNERSFAWLVVDSYAFTDELEEQLAGSSTPLAVFDDCRHANHHSAAMIINGNAHASFDLYPTAKRSRLLLGTRYLALRREFQVPVRSREFRESPRHILITLGGTCPLESCLEIWRAIAVRRAQRSINEAEAIPKNGRPWERQKGSGSPGESHLVKVSVLAGSQSEELQRLIKVEPLHIEIDTEVLGPIDDVAQLFQMIDLAISAGGSTLYELARFGIPTIALCIADNQVPGATRLGERGIVQLARSPWTPDQPSVEIALEMLLNDPDRRGAMSHAGQLQVDGQGAKRIAERLNFEPIVVRPAQSSDSARLYALRNDPVVIQNSIVRQPVEWESHSNWLARRLDAADSMLLVAESRLGDFLGQVRFDWSDSLEAAVVSISVSEPVRGMGLAGVILRAAIEILRKGQPNLLTLVAMIRPDNTPSQSLFQSNGFARASEDATGDNDTTFERWSMSLHDVR